jgi:hypothetical protein
VNYFSRHSDRLLGILAGLQQMMSADERASSYLAMSQCAHAGRLLLAEYGGDLKRALLQHLGLQGCGGPLLVSAVRVGLEEGVWNAAPPLE